MSQDPFTDIGGQRASAGDYVAYVKGQGSALNFGRIVSISLSNGWTYDPYTGEQVPLHHYVKFVIATHKRMKKQIVRTAHLSEVIIVPRERVPTNAVDRLDAHYERETRIP